MTPNRLRSRRPLSLALALALAAAFFGVDALCGPAFKAQTLAPPSGGSDSAGAIEKIEVLGLSRMARKSLLIALGVDEGDAYDPAKIRRSFKKLWDLGVFEDITIDAEDGTAGGKVLVIRLVERPVLTSIEYEDNKVASRTEIEDALTERDLSLKLSKPLDLGQVFFAESAIRDLLSQKGYLSASVEAEVTKVTETTRALKFKISPGGKTRIRKINFVGNETFKDGRLLSELELTQARRWYWPWSRKNLYHQVKWDQDVSNIRDLYQERGYLDVEIRPPVVEVRTEGDEKIELSEATVADEIVEVIDPTADGTVVLPQPPVFDETVPEDTRRVAMARYENERKKAEKRLRKIERKRDKLKSRRWVELTVPIEEGEPYTLGNVSISGSTIVTEQVLRNQFIRLREGMVVNTTLLDLGVDAISRFYENRGHLYAKVVQNLQRREGGERIADLEITVDESDPYTVSRVQFSGNPATLDNVLRREVALIEGKLFNRDALEFSKIKLNQLGYWQTTGDPITDPTDSSQQVLVTIAGEEQGRNEIQVGGGYSGLDGAFFNGVYSTRNFLGRGQVLSTSLQIGGRTDRYQISFQEPWFLNRPILLGFNIFRRDVDYGATLRSTSTGGGVVVGKRVGKFSRVNLGYNYEEVESRTQLLNSDSTLITTTARNKVSSLTPVYSISTLNNPYRATSGSELVASVQVAGGPLGGDTAYIKPIVRMTGYLPTFRRKAYIGMHAQFGYVTEWDEGTTANSSLINGIPQYQRFWVGGDTQGPRVFETRTISPLRYVTLAGNRIDRVLSDPTFLTLQELANNGRSPILAEVGGNRYFLYQSELVFPLNEQVDVAAFLDFGDSFFEDQSFNLETTRVSAGLEVRFNLPIFPVPLRLIYGVPVRKLEGDRTSSFSFSVGKSF